MAKWIDQRIRELESEIAGIDGRLADFERMRQAADWPADHPFLVEAEAAAQELRARRLIAAADLHVLEKRDPQSRQDRAA